MKRNVISEKTNRLHNLNNQNATLKEPEKVELISDEVQEILGRVPPWIVRRGISVILVIVILVILSSFIIKYPDVITSSIVIISENPPVSIVAQSTCIIEYLFAQNGIDVKQGEVLAILENTANYNKVFELKKMLLSLSKVINQADNSFFPDLSDYYNLGPVQSAYFNFQRQYKEYLNFISTTAIDKKIALIQQQKKTCDAYIIRLLNQTKIQEESIVLSHRQFYYDSILFRRGAITELEYEKSEQTYLQISNAYQNLMLITASAQMQINQLNYQIIDLQSQKADEAKRLQYIMKEAYDNLNISISNWEKAYVLIAPIEGRVVFNKYWSKNQYITTGDIVFTIVPKTPQQIFGHVKLPISGSSKVKPEQRVLIFLDNYPYTEYGMIEGRVQSISLIPESTQQGVYYIVEIALPKGLSTTYKNILPFNQEMQGSAEIVTKNLTLFERFINPIKIAL